MSINHSPRIRGDGPQSCAARSFLAAILPVFAGMVPTRITGSCLKTNSPRIRGDGPLTSNFPYVYVAFSPYSRGWSVSEIPNITEDVILPVFAGMVPSVRLWSLGMLDSPRIRGDGPHV